MALSSHITDLITAYKEMPNGERRNKVISHLKDAEAHAKLLEQESAARYGVGYEEVEGTAVEPSPVPCICKPGVRNNRCVAVEHVA